MRLQRMILALAVAAALPAFAAENTTTDVTDAVREARAELREARNELRALTRRIGELQRQLGPEDGMGRAFAFSYLSDPKRAMIGVVLDQQSDGVHIAAVTPGGPAEKAGVRAGDRIVSVNGKAIAPAGRPTTPGEALREADDVERTRDAIGKVEPGQNVALVVERGGAQKQFTVVAERRESWEWPMLAGAMPALAPLPEQIVIPDVRVIVEKDGERPHVHALDHEIATNINRELRRVMISRGGALFDLKLAPVNDGLGRYFGTDSGVLVLDKGDATLAGIQTGDVITSIGGQRVESTTDAMRALTDHDAGSTVNVEVMRDRKRVVVAVAVPERELMDIMVPIPPVPPTPPAAPRPAAAPKAVPVPRGMPAPAAPPEPPTPPPPGRGRAVA